MYLAKEGDLYFVQFWKQKKLSENFFLNLS